MTLASGPARQNLLYWRPMSIETKLSNPVTRVLSAAAALAIVLPTLAFGGTLGVYAITAVVLVWAQHEYAGMAFPQARRAAAALLALMGALTVAAVQTQRFTLLAAALLLQLMGSAWWVLFRPREDVSGMHNEWSRLALGLVYVPLPLGFFPLLLELPDGHGWGWVLLTMAATWGGDTGAFFAGRAFGRTPLFPLVSPKKTWEGLVGGLAMSTALCVGFKYAFFPWVSVVDCVVLGVFINLAGVTGDLVESMLKRDAGIKDSGMFLPGHGGMLDRIDSILFTLPLTWIYVSVMYSGG